MLQLLSYSHVTKGIFWKIVSCFCFSAINICIRYLATGMQGKIVPLSVHVIYFFQYLCASCLILPFIGMSVLKLQSRQGLKLHSYRIVASVVGTICLYFSFRNMPVVQVLALAFIGPAFTVVLASVFLKERITIIKTLAILASVVGALLILQPNYNADNSLMSFSASLLPFVSTLAFVIAKITTRQLINQGETAENLTAYLFLLTLPITGFFALSTWQMPTGQHFLCLLCLGGITAVAFFAFNQAYKYAEVTFLMPFGAVKFFTSIMLSIILFDEYPKNIASWFGIGIIAFGVMLLSYKQDKIV